MAATTRTSEKTALLARLPPFPQPRGAADRGRVLHWPPVPGGATSGRRVWAGQRSRPRSRSSPTPPPAPSARPTTGTSDLGLAVEDVLEGADRDRRPGARADADRGRRDLRGDRPMPRARRRRRRSFAAAPRAVVAAHRQVPRQGPHAASCASAAARVSSRPRSPRRSTVRSTSEVGRDAHRRHRADRRARPGRPAGGLRLALFHPLKFMLASPGRGRDGDHDPARPDRLGRGQVRRHPRPARIARATRSASTRRDLHDISDQFPEIVDGGDGSRLGRASSTARSSPGATAPSCRSSRSRRGSAARTPSAAIREEIPVIFVAFDVLGLGRAMATAGRAAAARIRSRAPRAARRPRPPARPTQGGRFAARHLESVDSIDGLEQAFAEARARRNEGLMVKDPTSGYSPGRRG